MDAFFIPVDPAVIRGHFESGSLFHQIEKHTPGRFPDLQGAKLALLGIRETRDTEVESLHFREVRAAFYRLCAGAWDLPLVDLGDILAGQSLEDTYFALKQVLQTLLKNDTLPLLLGGAQHLTYAHYRAYDALDQFVNLAVIDKKLSLREGDAPRDFLARIIAEPPTRLFDLSLIGFQQYFVSPQATDLMEKLYFEHIRLGKTLRAPLEAEPLIRNADLVSITLAAAALQTAPGCAEATANGMDGITLCTLSRFAGLSNKVSSFGIYEYAPQFDRRNATAQLIAQMLWHFIEGFSLRRQEYPQIRREDLMKYHIPIDGKDMIFYKNKETERWWMQVELQRGENPKKHLIPCSYADYLETTRENIPEKWWKYYQKLL